MRIEVLEANQGSDLMAGPGDVYAPEISSAGNEFASAIYRHSRLPLRTFEAARMATAIINGCLICKNWRTHRDVPKLGIETGVIDNGEIPDEDFYQALLNNELSTLDTKERLAVEFARLMGTAPQELSANDDFWDKLKSSFTDAEITDLTYSVAGWMGMGRVFHVLGMDQHCST